MSSSLAANLSKCASEPDIPLRPPVRPNFHHRNTDDRIREGSGRPLSIHMISKIRKDRKSVFKELGLDTDLGYTPDEKVFGEITGLSTPVSASTKHSGRNFEGGNETESDDGKGTTTSSEQQRQEEVTGSTEPTSPATPTSQKWYSRFSPGRRPKIRTAASAPPPGMAGITRLTTIALLIAVVLPGFGYFNGRSEKVVVSGADAGVIQQRPKGFGPVLDTRAPSPTKVCKRWAQQTALLNGTLYIYGGQAKTTSDQGTDTWNNDFLTLDLTKSWDTSTPSFRGLAQPSGPPAVANGYLWNDYNNLYLYGGLFSDKPPVEPAPESLWKYSIRSQSWTEFPGPRTSKGNHSDAGDVPVQRSAEGAGISVPELGLSWYFGGHLDHYTTTGWSIHTARIYLKSLLEFTHPGYTNDGVEALASGTGAGSGGAFRNITQGKILSSSGFPERADGVLVFVPGWGEKGVLIGLAGGTTDGVSESFSESMETLDVYDIATSEWFHQKTSGEAPGVRVNPCAVIASAPDASSFNIYLYGGQNLQPYMGQTQYSDMYILSIPSFTWIRVEQYGNGPPPRAGHTCNLRDGQIIIVGGYVNATSIPCESPGVFVFDASALRWTNRFNALNHPPDIHPDNSVLANSYGYKVPDIVASVIGGDSSGGATATTPAAGPATDGPFATGKPPVFTVTAAGTTATVTQWGPDATGGIPPGGDSSSSPNDPSNSRRAGLIAAGIIAALAGLLSLYLGYCAWLYRRQVRAYRSHLALTNNYNPAGASTASGLAAFFGGAAARRGTSTDNLNTNPFNEKRTTLSSTTPMAEPAVAARHRSRLSTSTADSVAWVGAIPATEPKLFFGLGDDETTPDSGYSHSSMSPPPGAGAGGLYPARPSWADSSPTNSGTGTGSGLYPARPSWHAESSASGSGISRPSPLTAAGSGSSPGAVVEEEEDEGGQAPRRSDSGGSMSSAERLLDGQEPSFFNVVMKPRRALRVVNGLEGEMEQAEGREGWGGR
ncbi:hypothetical protein QBC34DRAFT_66116 [Podospora aff. communis PSN243]|uniref:Uncharacterized protein n=1 Tax=Podospora aff. communis PSN243 TaxID=3040156 RepID=A0AAV9GW86_9PEZI|nr:hypothetical protein QBC34DRAFT_66116 [Podospora aff. communis PSN243]